MGIDPAALHDIVRRALDEDRAFDDITTNAIVPADARGTARLIARERCVVAGLDAFEDCFTELDQAVVVKRLVLDGEEARLWDWQGTDNTYGSRHYVDVAKRDGSLATLKALVLTLCEDVRHIDAKPMTLRSIFTTLAPTAREGATS